MILYLAPLEEVTGFVFRNALEEVFGGVDKYFTPFIAPTQKKILKTRERRDVEPENNRGLYVVPQILTANPIEFVDTAKLLYSYGYKEINFNAGCPSGTVTSKGKGAGFLKDTFQMVKFWDSVFENLEKSNLSDVKVSIKTRLGVSEDWEFEDIIDIYNRYPFEEVIVHGRLMKQVYSGEVDIKSFAYALDKSKNRISINGDIVDKDSLDNTLNKIKVYIKNNYVNLEAIPVMIGRGAITNPGIFRELKSGVKPTRPELKMFHDKVYLGYCDIFSPKDALFKMKEFWFYFGKNFEKCEKELKTIKKTGKTEEYLCAVSAIFDK